MGKNRKFYHSGRIVSLLLALLMVTTLTPITAFAEETAKYELYVNGKQFTESETVITCGNGTATFDTATNTLTLNNATITTGVDGQYGMINSNLDDLTITLIGNNVIEDSNSKGFDGIDAGSGKNVTINGSGVLTMKNIYYGTYIGSSIGGKMTIENTTVKVENSTAAGIWAGGDIALKNSTVEISRTSERYAGMVSASGSVTVTNSTLKIDNKCDAITAYSKFTVNSGNVSLKTSVAGYTISLDDKTNGRIEINGGTLELSSVKAGTNIPSENIKIADSLQYITGSSLTSSGAVKISSAQDQTITKIDIGNIWTNLDTTKPISFTAEVNPNSECVNQMEIVREGWVSKDETDFIMSDDPEDEQYPIEGKTYYHGIVLKPKDGYVFSKDFVDNFENVTFIYGGSKRTDVRCEFNEDGDKLFIFGIVDDVTATKSGGPQSIDAVKITNVTLSYKDGDKFVFTAESEEPDLYTVYLETYTDKATGDYLSSSDFFNNEEHRGNYNLLETATGGKTYSWRIWLKPAEKDGVPMVTFESTTKIVINGKTYILADNGTKPEAVHNQYDLMFYAADDIVVPKAGEGHTHTYGDWKSDGTNHWKECSCGDKADTAAHDFKWVTDKEATATEAGSKHEECKTCGYKKAAVEIPATGTTGDSSKQEDTKTNTGDKNTNTTSPQTGDNSNMILWIALLFVSCSGLMAVTFYGKKKKANR